MDKLERSIYSLRAIIDRSTLANTQARDEYNDCESQLGAGAEVPT